MKRKKTTLYIFSVLPACGKTTLAEKLAIHTGSFLLRIDTIEQGLRDLCALNVQGEGYRLSYKIAEDNLKLGSNVIADCCNPINQTRKEWEKVANSCGVNYENIEIICSDSSVLKKRVENRKSTVPNLKLPTWQKVISREYHIWNCPHHIIETSNRDIDECFNELVNKLDIIKNNC